MTAPKTAREALEQAARITETAQLTAFAKLNHEGDSVEQIIRDILILAARNIRALAASLPASSTTEEIVERLQALDAWIQKEHPTNDLDARAVVRDALRTIVSYSQSERPANEYICKCGVRVTPHRCQEGTDF